MLREFKFPDVGEGIAEGEIVRWLVKAGDAVKEDQDLLEVETDKALLTLNSPYTGKVARLHGKEGDIIKVGDVLTTVDAGGEEGTVTGAEKGDSGTVVGTLTDNEVVEVIRPVQATPAVRALAKQMEIDLASVTGTGPGGRITKEDVETTAMKTGQQTSAEADAYGLVEKIPLRGIRRTVAKRMAEASNASRK